jgi:integrase
VKVFFNFARDEGYLERVVRYGQGFKVPSASVLRRSRASRMFEPGDIQALLGGAGRNLKAMILLGINCGFGNQDCATLPWSAIRGAWVIHSRPKTGIERRCPLWPETLAALEVLKGKHSKHSKHSEHANLVFVTKYGATWQSGVQDSPISKEFRKLCNRAGVYGPGFYGLRHTFATVALRLKDRDTVRAMMGHAAGANDMLAVYNEEPVSDERLLAVSNYVHAWLYPSER